MKNLSFCLLLMTITPAQPLLAQQSQVDGRIVANEELNKLRGGLRVGGLDIRLGADISTYLNGDLALHTIMHWTGDGVVTEQQASSALSRVDAEALAGAIIGDGSIHLGSGTDGPVYLANNGATAIIHQTSGGLQNILLNTATATNISQQIDATLDISGYSDFARNIAQSQIGNVLGDNMQQAASAALGF